MRVAIIGAGNMGGGLAARLAGKVDLALGVRNVSSGRALADQLGGAIEVLDGNAAASQADIVVLALPYATALEYVRHNAALDGKVVVDMSNPVKDDFSGLLLGFDTSAGEELQKAAPRAKVVKAYNTIFAGLFAVPAAATSNVPVFISGDDEAAVQMVVDLVVLSGFGVEHTGGLDGARLVEPLGMLNIRLGYGLGKGTSIAPSWKNIAA